MSIITECPECGGSLCGDFTYHVSHVAGYDTEAGAIVDGTPPVTSYDFYPIPHECEPHVECVECGHTIA